jgi:hypothetical protein
MRNGQNKRMRGRGGGSAGGNRKSQNPLTRVYESNGPDIKIRGTPSHIAEKYLQLARDAQSSGDPVAAENYFQHAEHYFRLIAAAQEQFRQSQPQFYRPEQDTRHDMRGDDVFDDDEGIGPQPGAGPGESPYGVREPQPYLPRDAQPFPTREQQQFPPREQQPFPPRQPHGGAPAEASGDIGGLPSFITGGSQPQPHGASQGSHGSNGYEGGQPDRFPLHRRRRRHRGPRPEMQGSPQASAGDQRPEGD